MPLLQLLCTNSTFASWVLLKKHRIKLTMSLPQKHHNHRHQQV